MGGVYDSGDCSLCGIADPREDPPPGQNRDRELPCGQLAHTLRDTRRYPQTLLFLVAYLIYNDAIQTVLAVAAQFGSDGLDMPISQVDVGILMAQFVGIFGAIGFGRLAARIGAKLRDRHDAVHLDRDADLHLRFRCTRLLNSSL